MSTATTAGREKLRDGEHHWLPPGYFLRGYGRLLSDPDTPCLWNIYRPDGTPIDQVLIGQTREHLEEVAWRCYRREVLQEIEGGRCTANMPEGYGRFEYQGEWIVARPDNSVVAYFSIYTTTDVKNRAAWDDYRRRTFRVLRNVEVEREELRCG